ncbi:MAG: phosphate signaling complex protein PhoU [Ardenticatenaceae bacterium]|nr:phosphate signaling complex protein PhoU [Anaerolineales bacterium]MCB8921468.1 phosphate signaling complex protein PhoU [Ardenticatenaceae bacterium]MCB9004942.1 phosphate signaling complex protein PhoU [Ardenticatenaceae bacterium]
MPFTNRSVLDKHLMTLQEKLLQMTSLIDTATEQALNALSTRDIQLAEQVIVGDEEINRLRHDVEELAHLVLATQQPAAGDLRTIIASTHVAVELERMGDHASGIARLVLRMEEEEDIDNLHKLPKMCKRARKMLQESIQAFIERDTNLAFQMMKRDEKLDNQYNRLFRETIKEMKNEAYAQRATYLLWVGHNLERIGDRAINIAERVIFMITGEFVENVGDLDDLT